MKRPKKHTHLNDADAGFAPPDPSLVATLRSVVAEPPYHLVDWDTLRASIVGDAAALLTHRIRRSWMTYVSRWSSTIVPAGIAASILAAFLLLHTQNAGQVAATGETALSPAALLGTVTGVSSSRALAASVTEPLAHHMSVDLLFEEDTQ